MTTATTRTPFAGLRPLLGAAVAAVLAGTVVVVLAGFAGGSEAVFGAVLGTLLATGVFAFGAFVVNAVAGVMPSAALLVALLTYTLQVVLMGLVFWAVSTSAEAGSTLDKQWLGAAMIAATLGWLTGQVTLTTRQRIPAYDLPPGESAPALTGGER
ncbi:hypothetical protein [Nocardioides sp.]|uniref:hypothetical protein n=1 Tax=Nocardioides sp. TaxID=35761 RepID=UPI002D1FA16C|nr:hypothetical protein [Nocardioides sp.]